MENYFIIKPREVKSPNLQEIKKELWIKQNNYQLGKDFKINKMYQIRLLNIVNNSKSYKKNIINLFLYGISGTGKTTLARCYINEYLQFLDTNLKLECIKTDSKELEYFKGVFHTELIIYKYNFNDITLINKFFSEVCRDNDNNFSGKKNIVLIKNIELLRRDNLYLVKYNIEKYSNYNVFIIISKQSPPKELKGLLCQMRIPKSQDKELLVLSEDILNNANIDYKIQDIQSIVKKCDGNMSKNVNLLQYSYITCKYENFDDCDESKFVFLYKLLKKKNLKNVFLIRELCVDLLSENINSQDILKYILKKIINSKNISHEKKKKIIKILVSADLNDKKSFRNVIHLEYAFIQIINIL